MLAITVTILTYNSERLIEKVLASVSEFKEVIVADSGSTDRTLDIAESFPNVRIEKVQFKGFGPLHNEVSEKARYDWVFSLDSDEIVSPALLEEIKQLPLDSQTVYEASRHNFFAKKWIKGCGWYPDRQIKLYNRQVSAFSNDQVHERILSEGLNVQRLENPVFHYPYPDIQSFLAKMQHYSDLFAKQGGKSKQASPMKAFWHAQFAFFKSYFLKGGIFLGWQGYLISKYNADVAYYKYLKLFEQQCSQVFKTFRD